MKEKVNIEELIADARAEEEAARSLKDDIRAELRSKSEAEETVKITVKEYVSLVMQAADLKRFLYEIANDLELSYNKEHLTINGSKTLKCLEILYPDICKDVFELLTEEEKQEETEGE